MKAQGSATFTGCPTSLNTGPRKMGIKRRMVAGPLPPKAKRNRREPTSQGSPLNADLSTGGVLNGHHHHSPEKNGEKMKSLPGCRRSNTEHRKGVSMGGINRVAIVAKQKFGKRKGTDRSGLTPIKKESLKNQAPRSTIKYVLASPPPRKRKAAPRPH